MGRKAGEVIVIEDHAESRGYLTRLLELEGYEVAAFANGADALEYLDRSPTPRVIIMDIRMPVMDGTEFRAAMLKDQRLADIPVIVVTALEPPFAETLTPLRVFRKPLDVDALLNTMRDRY